MFNFSKKQNIEDIPPHLFLIETSLLCELKCPECALGGGIINRKKGVMSFETFKVIADKIRPYAKFLFLINWGEPVLNKDIVKIINYASQFARTNISTNGMSLTPDLAEELVNSGLNEILVSIDGVTQEVYEKYRCGGDLKKALAALEMLNEANVRHGNKLKIFPQFVVFKHNQHEMKEFKKYCNSLGLKPTFKAPYIKNDSTFSQPDNKKYQRKRYKDEKSLKKAMTGCKPMIEGPTILVDGTVISCCYDHNGVTGFGNLLEQDFMEIWNSPECLAFRKSVLNGNPPKFCLEHCLLYTLDNKSCGV